MRYIDSQQEAKKKPRKRKYYRIVFFS